MMKKKKKRRLKNKNKNNKTKTHRKTTATTTATTTAINQKQQKQQFYVLLRSQKSPVKPVLVQSHENGRPPRVLSGTLTHVPLLQISGRLLHTASTSRGVFTTLQPLFNIPVERQPH